MSVRPGDIFPTMVLGRVGGADQILPKIFSAQLTLVEFYRGFHCPRCRARLEELNSLCEEFAEAGIESISVSMDTKDRATNAVRDWDMKALPVFYGLKKEEARKLDLLISRSINEREPRLFCEPATFLVKTGGEIYVMTRSSMPIMRSNLRDALVAAEYLKNHRYPARGDQ